MFCTGRGKVTPERSTGKKTPKSKVAPVLPLPVVSVAAVEPHRLVNAVTLPVSNPPEKEAKPKKVRKKSAPKVPAVVSSSIPISELHRQTVPTNFSSNMSVAGEPCPLTMLSSIATTMLPVAEVVPVLAPPAALYIDSRAKEPVAAAPSVFVPPVLHNPHPESVTVTSTTHHQASDFQEKSRSLIGLSSITPAEIGEGTALPVQLRYVTVRSLFQISTC